MHPRTDSICKHRPEQAGNFTDTLLRMRIDAASQAAARAFSATKADSPGRLNYQVRLLKRAHESHKEQAANLNKLLESKGQVIDIRA